MVTHTSKTTTDHATIRKWVEEHKGHPASVEGTAHGSEEAGLLRIDLPGGASDPPLNRIAWDEFFKKFDEAKLAFVYQEKKADGEPSSFCKFVSREA